MRVGTIVRYSDPRIRWDRSYEISNKYNSNWAEFLLSGFGRDGKEYIGRAEGVIYPEVHFDDSVEVEIVEVL